VKPAAPRSTLRRAPLWALALGFCALFVSAGLWQAGRAVQKEALLADSARVLEERKPVELPDAARAMPAWVAIEGRFESHPALRLDNQRRGPRVGVQVYRRFATDDGTRLWVDIGWRALPPDRVVPVEPALPTESMRLEGLLVPPPSAGIALGPAASPTPDGGALALRLEPAVLRESGATLAHAVLRLDPAIALGHERDLDLLANTLSPDKHRGYALQWFGFAAGLLLLSLYLQFRRRP
jgi:cytochrome oxidase assembly protein ShyY1